MLADLTADAWLAGFIDGEGYFRVAVQQQRAAGAFVPIFGIGLRVDDLPVLRQAQAAFGGRIAIKPAVGRAKPVAQWSVVAKADLRRIVAYLDHFPLRSKKARDYAVWREAVLLYVTHGSRHPDLALLREALDEARVYEEPAEVVELRAVGT